MINPRTITIYNRYMVGLPPFPPSVRYEATRIYGCHYEDEVLTNPDSGGRPTIGQTATVLIPVDADQSGKTYVKSERYANMPNDTTNYWTANKDPSNPDYFILGEGRELNDLYTIESLKRDHRVFAIQGVADSWESSIQPHLEIAGI